MIQWYKKVVFENYANFNGRARRSEYWNFTLTNVIVSLILGFIGVLIGIGTIISDIYSLMVLVPTIAVTIRRMHDVGKNGWFMLIPIYNLILACTNGIEGENQYGPDPKGDTINEIGKE